ncbi:MAG: hypothetical protein II608_06590 [Oscillospiraceae bacterium]|nr:hypothetical protein [Oscillospiraceae bacterium]
MEKNVKDQNVKVESQKNEHADAAAAEKEKKFKEQKAAAAKKFKEKGTLKNKCAARKRICEVLLPCPRHAEIQSRALHAQ